MIKKGSIVLVKAVCHTGYPSKDDLLNLWEMDSVVHEPSNHPMCSKKVLVRSKLYRPGHGLVIGRTYRATGYARGHRASSYDSYDDYDPPYLEEDKRHWGWLVEPLDDTVLYRKPVFVLEEDLEEVDV